jgi:protein-S-isoprenylcysteine O-methyltransferase Ste14
MVAFPLYVWFTGILVRRLRRNPELRASKIRKWLTYLTLFVASATIIADLITLLTRLLQGELTTRFVLKVLVVLVIAVLVFIYYLSDLRPEEKEEP